MNPTDPTAGSALPQKTGETRARANRALGHTQQLVLRLLAAGPKSAQHLAYDWPTLTESSSRASVMRLARRGLVDLAGWNNSNQRTYRLTDKGAEVERALNVEEEK